MQPGLGRVFLCVFVKQPVKLCVLCGIIFRHGFQLVLSHSQKQFPVFSYTKTGYFFPEDIDVYYESGQ